MRIRDREKLLSTNIVSIFSTQNYTVDDRIEKYDAYVFDTALAHPPTTPVPHARLCGLWVPLGRYNS